MLINHSILARGVLPSRVASPRITSGLGFFLPIAILRRLASAEWAWTACDDDCDALDSTGKSEPRVREREAWKKRDLARGAGVRPFAAGPGVTGEGAALYC